MLLEDTQSKVPKDNMGGLKKFIYIAEADDIATFPKPDQDYENASTFAELATISTDITFQSGKCFKKVAGVYRKNNLAVEAQGEVQSRSAMNKVVIEVPGNEAQTIGLIEFLKNEELIVIAEDITGQYRVLGEPDLPAFLETFNQGTGEGVTGERKSGVNFFSEGKIAPVYKGMISLTPAI